VLTFQGCCRPGIRISPVRELQRFSPRVILAFSPSREVQFTAQVGRGFRLGASTIHSTWTVLGQ